MDRMAVLNDLPGSATFAVTGRSLWRYLWVALIFWTILIALVFAFNLYHHRMETLEFARGNARAAFDKDLVYRRWVTRQGGVYVKKSDHTPPNPYLAHIPDRDVVSDKGGMLTLVNPAYMTRQVHELGFEQYGLRGHITSLNPLRPSNAPDSWERTVLQGFASDPREISSVETIDGGKYLRLMKPMMTEEGCLKCHAFQGYQVGDVRGGISVSVPMEPLWAIARGRMIKNLMGYGFIWLIGSGLITGLFINLRDRIRERDAAELDRLAVIKDLRKALSEVKTLEGLIPICSGCKKVRDDNGYWQQVEGYIAKRSDAEFSHSICPDCMKKLYPEYCEEIYPDKSGDVLK